MNAGQAVATLRDALASFLRAPSTGSNGPGSVTIAVQTHNLEAARSALAATEAPEGLEVKHREKWLRLMQRAYLSLTEEIRTDAAGTVNVARNMDDEHLVAALRTTLEEEGVLK